MNATPTPSSSSPHPVIWIAGIAVTLFSLVGIASLTGLLPSKSAPPANPPAVIATTPATTPAPAPATPNASAPAEAAAPPPASAPQPASAPAPTRHKAAAKHKAREVAALPPPGSGVPPDYVAPATPSAPACRSCGVIADIRQVKHEGEGSGLGAVGGGLVGGALANNIGQGNGRTLATIAGMAGGALLGNKIEKSQRATVSYEVSVRMEDGTSQLISYENPPSWRVGDAVKIVNGTLVAR